MHDEERSRRPSIIADDLVELVRERIMENLHFTITELSGHFPHIFRLLATQNSHGVTVVQKIVCQRGTKTTDTRTQSKALVVSIDISAATQIMKRGLRTLQKKKKNSSQCIGVTVDLPARRNSSRICRRGK